MKYYYLLIIFAVIFISCNGEPVESEDDVFSGITETGPENYQPVGKIDEDDWQVIFVSGNMSDDLINGFLGLDIKPAYPNPAESKVNLVLSISKASKITIYISDKPKNIFEYIVKDEQKSSGNHSYKYTFKQGTKAGIYRIYYEITTPSAVYKSYGDVQYNP